MLACVVVGKVDVFRSRALHGVAGRSDAALEEINRAHEHGVADLGVEFLPPLGLFSSLGSSAIFAVVGACGDIGVEFAIPGDWAALKEENIS